MTPTGKIYVIRCSLPNALQLSPYPVVIHDEWIALNSSLSGIFAQRANYIIFHRRARDRIADPLRAGISPVCFFFLPITTFRDPRSHYHLACGRDEPLACFNRSTILEPRSRSTREMHRLRVQRIQTDLRRAK